MKKVFLSQPFTGRTEKDIFMERNYVRTLAEKVLKDEVEIIDQYHQELARGQSRGWLMINDLKMILQADYVIFAPGWKKSSGCRMEMEFCKKYAIQYVQVTWLEKMQELL